MPKSVIPAATIAAYKATLFNVLTSPPFTLKVNTTSESLKHLFQQHQASSAAFITAFNPYSEPLKEDENIQRNRALLTDLEVFHTPIFEGIGCDPDGVWPGEPSYLVLNIAKNDAIAVANKYQQNAIVWCGKSGKVELVTLR
jgi:hypothetical protein